MAKVAFTKLGKIKSSDNTTCIINGETITVKTYLPLNEKLDLLTAVIEQAGEKDTGFCNIVQLQVFYTIEMIKVYTNISFTEKQLEDPGKLYDLILLNKIWEPIKQAIPEEEQKYVWDSLISLAAEIANYNRSALGILKSMKTDYNNLDLDATQIEDKLANEDNLSLLKDVLEKLS